MPARNARLALALAVLFAPGGRAAQNTESSTLADQKDLAVTVYNSNIALVRDVRRHQGPDSPQWHVQGLRSARMKKWIEVARLNDPEGNPIELWEPK